MPQDTTTHAVPPASRLGWFSAARLHTRPIRRWIGQAAKAAPGEDWTASKSSRSSRRPVWE